MSERTAAKMRDQNSYSGGPFGQLEPGSAVRRLAGDTNNSCVDRPHDREFSRAQQRGTMTNRYIAVGVLVAALAATAHGQQTSVDQRLEQLEQEIRLLKQQRELDREEAQQKALEKAKNTPILQAGENGFAFKSADSNFVLRVRGYVQADGRFYLNDDANNGNDTFLLRRVRPVFEGTVFRDFDFRLMPDFGNGANSTNIIQDAYLEWKYWPFLKVRAGKYKPPVGLEMLQSDTDLLFAERGLPTDLVPQRDVGVQLSGDLLDGVISYAGGVFNGVVDGGIADLDTFDSKDADARVWFQPFKKAGVEPLQGLGFGVAGTIGSENGSLASPNLPSYKTTGQNTFFKYLGNTTNLTTTAIANGSRDRLSPQASYYWGPVGVFGEYVICEQEVMKGASSNRLRNQAWQVAGSWVVTGENASYKAVTPRQPFDLKKGGWGALELTARYGVLRIDKDAFPTYADPNKSAQEAREWGVGANWYLNRNVKLVLDYEQTAFNGGAAGGADRETERVIFTRAQLQF